ncbi:MAG: Cys-tRNA(Pro) deacylase, partial [Candidatus Melainabacteria bacterium HGW-Melainabacteria-1]
AGLDLKSLARASGNKRVELVPLKEVQPLTGYVRGGVSPLGSARQFELILDELALVFERISVSAGQRGLQLFLNPQDLVQATKASLAGISTYD